MPPAVSASQSSAVASKETETVSSETEENINALYTPASASGLSVPSTFKEPADICEIRGLDGFCDRAGPI